MANRSSNTAAVPEAKGALDKFKFEVARRIRFRLKIKLLKHQKVSLA